MKQHKWHKEIKAWADGAEIECRTDKKDEWEFVEEPLWLNNCEYRIKPQPKEEPYWYCKLSKFNIKPQANEPQYLYAWQNNLHEITLTTNPPHPLKEYVNINFKCIGKIKLEPEYE